MPKLTVIYDLPPNYDARHLIEHEHFKFADWSDLRENKWRDAVEDQLVIHHIFNDSHKDPRKAVSDLISIVEDIALDPKVSPVAARWKEILEVCKRMNRVEEPVDKVVCTCRFCGGQVRGGEALEQTWIGTGKTQSAGGSGKLIDCLKCESCGWSVTK